MFETATCKHIKYSEENFNIWFEFIGCETIVFDTCGHVT